MQRHIKIAWLKFRCVYVNINKSINVTTVWQRHHCSNAYELGKFI